LKRNRAALPLAARRRTFCSGFVPAVTPPALQFPIHRTANRSDSRNQQVMESTNSDLLPYSLNDCIAGKNPKPEPNARPFTTQPSVLFSTICRRALSIASARVPASSYFHPMMMLCGNNSRSLKMTFVAGSRWMVNAPERLAILGESQLRP